MEINEQDLTKIIEEKTQEATYKQKTQELYILMSDLMNKLPNSLNELEKTIQLIIASVKEHSNTSDKQVDDILSKINSVNKDLNGLFRKVEELYSTASAGEQKLYDAIVDQNNPYSLIKKIEEKFDNSEKRMLDKNDDKSLISTVTRLLNGISTKIDKGQNVRSIITWIIASASTITLIIKWIIELNSK